ncbi:DUF1989 domain-containing protein [Tateyamaria pelophila]|uniref:DUF1989 domain-containing protein n=1 Tax=Tateyamaria pelophila TaxID=328415 RepID=UPI0029588A4B|nr:DUF1989 domain-containing protein [Tateyamaria pelophila]
MPVGGFFRITLIGEALVGNLNLCNAHDLSERFYSGRTRGLHGTYISMGNRLWRTLPFLRLMATAIRDLLDCYGSMPSAVRCTM